MSCLQPVCVWVHWTMLVFSSRFSSIFDKDPSYQQLWRVLQYNIIYLYRHTHTHTPLVVIATAVQMARNRGTRGEYAAIAPPSCMFCSTLLLFYSHYNNCQILRGTWDKRVFILIILSELKITGWNGCLKIIWKNNRKFCCTHMRGNCFFIMRKVISSRGQKTKSHVVYVLETFFNKIKYG